MGQQLGFYDVGEKITLGCWFLTGGTVGTIFKGQMLLEVRDVSGLDVTPAAAIYVAEAGGIGGDLVSTVVSSGAGQVTIADPAMTTANRVLVGTPVDPSTVTCKVAKPDGNEATLTAVSTQTGRWTAAFTPTLDGDHFYRFSGSGAAVADGWRKFVVDPERVV
jgi:hypothetical protein